MQFSISFNYVCRQLITMDFAVPVTSSAGQSLMFLYHSAVNANILEIKFTLNF